ncbi:hypothetical protein HNQ76_002233 [Thermosulfuriphilus ammonigenes]|nr:DUF933 domain-containing protein [Thermosulfuriphilus ammonigenes]MBA2849831.1 hypothetical protein [Thermosulfuriphilus ammonigenes]
MKIGIIGLPGSGKTTIFNALTGRGAELSRAGAWHRGTNLAVVQVPDARLSALARLFNPSKITPATVEFVDVAVEFSEDKARDGRLEELIAALRPAQALFHVVRAFDLAGLPPQPQADLDRLESELVITDLISVERRLERLEKDAKRGKRPPAREYELLLKAREMLEAGRPLRLDREISEAPELKGFAFLTAKPVVVVLNLGDEAEAPSLKVEAAALVVIRGALELEVSQLPSEEAEVFRKEYGLYESAVDHLIQAGYRVLDLISFFTAGEKEVRAWTIRAGTTAVKAAGAVHSDMERGFIRAEVIFWEDLVRLGSYQAAREEGLLRLEGRDYIVQDGDVVIFRFKV